MTRRGHRAHMNKILPISDLKDSSLTGLSEHTNTNMFTLCVHLQTSFEVIILLSLDFFLYASSLPWVAQVTEIPIFLEKTQKQIQKVPKNDAFL